MRTNRKAGSGKAAFIYVDKCDYAPGNKLPNFKEPALLARLFCLQSSTFQGPAGVLHAGVQGLLNALAADSGVQGALQGLRVAYLALPILAALPKLPELHARWAAAGLLMLGGLPVGAASDFDTAVFVQLSNNARGCSWQNPVQTTIKLWSSSRLGEWVGRHAFGPDGQPQQLGADSLWHDTVTGVLGSAAAFQAIPAYWSAQPDWTPGDAHWRRLKAPAPAAGAHAAARQQ